MICLTQQQRAVTPGKFCARMITSAPAKRGFQFRLSGGTINFNPIAAGTSVTALLPIAGNNAFVNNTWFHVAAVYDGTNYYIYWTLVNPTNTVANLL